MPDSSCFLTSSKKINHGEVEIRICAESGREDRAAGKDRVKLIGDPQLRAATECDHQ
jgi:hypothetical protein